MKMMMKNSLITLALAGSLQWVGAQEHLPRGEALRYAFLVSADLTQLLGTPIPTDVDVKYAVGMRDGEYGALLLPEAKLTPETLTQVGSQWQSIGQLWLHRLTPLRDEWQALGQDQLRTVPIWHEDGQAVVPQCALAVRRDKEDSLELALFGKTPSPLLTVPLRQIKSSPSPDRAPMEMTAERTYDAGRITLRIVGQYEASLMVTEL